MTQHRTERIRQHPPLVGVELTRDELEDMDEGERCAAGLRCAGLLIGNLPAHVGWYLHPDSNGHDQARHASGWRFDGVDGVWCEDCTIEIEETDRESRGA